MKGRGCEERGRPVKAKRRRKARGRARIEQLCFDGVGFRAAKRRGKRKLGRPRSANPGVSHLGREEITKLTPVHVTVKAVEGLSSLRRSREHAIVVRKVCEARERAGRLEEGRFRVVADSGSPITHLVVEAAPPRRGTARIIRWRVVVLAAREGLLQLLPVLRGHVVRDLQGAVGAAVDRLLDADDLAAAEDGCISRSIAVSRPLICEPPPASSTRFFSLSWNSGSNDAISFARWNRR